MLPLRKKKKVLSVCDYGINPSLFIQAGVKKYKIDNKVLCVFRTSDDFVFLFFFLIYSVALFGFLSLRSLVFYTIILH